MSSPSAPQSDPTAPQPSPPDWERRFRAGRVGLPEWALNRPERCVVVATVGGVIEVHSWHYADAAGSAPTSSASTSSAPAQTTSRAEGTSHATVSPDGEWVWWFDDTDGDEFGVWRRQPFGSGPGQEQDATGLAPGYPSGLAFGADGLVIVAGDDDDGTRIHRLRLDVQGPATGPGPAELLYQHAESAHVADLSADDQLLAIGHSEHGDSRHPAARVIRLADGATVGELWDGPGKGVDAIEFCPLPGDTRLLVEHERRGRAELLVWDVTTGEQTELRLHDAAGIELDGEVSGAEWFRDASALLVALDHQARTRLYRVDPVTGTAEPIGPGTGTVGSATVRPDGDVWLLWTSAATPVAVRTLAGQTLLRPPGAPAPPSVAVEDVWVEGPGGRIHALLRRPAGGGSAAGMSGPLPLVVEVHGGPTYHDSDAFRAYASTWVDQGFAVVQVNYRGSTGYGSAWRDALESRIGHVELEDVVAVRDHLVRTGVADGSRVVLAGASWGGFLTLLGLGLYPDRWALGLAGVPVADYVAAYEDEMDSLKAFDRSLFGGTPEQVPDRYRDSSPITYLEQVRAPVLILAGENDPRCPIRQIDNYVAALGLRGLPHEVYRYDAGHGSLVDDERVRQMQVELDFTARHLP
jgi:dienelactone hydrolase